MQNEGLPRRGANSHFRTYLPNKPRVMKVIRLVLERMANRIPYNIHCSTFIATARVFLILHFAFCILNSSAAESARSLSDCTDCLCARHEAVQTVVARLRLTLHNV